MLYMFSLFFYSDMKGKWFRLLKEIRIWREKNVRWKESLVSGAGLASGVIGYRLVSISWIIIFNQEEEEKWMMMIIILKTMLMVSDRDFGDDDFHLSLIPLQIPR